MNEKVTLQNLIDIFSKENRLVKDKGDAFVRTFFDLIKEGLERDKFVKIKGFGTFKVIDIEPRESVNVNTGERFQIAGHSKVSFTPDASLKEIVNQPFSGFETVILNEGVVFDDKLDANSESLASVELEDAAIDTPTSEGLVAEESAVKPIEEVNELPETTEAVVVDEQEQTAEQTIPNGSQEDMDLEVNGEEEAIIASEESVKATAETDHLDTSDLIREEASVAEESNQKVKDNDIQKEEVDAIDNKPDAASPDLETKMEEPENMKKKQRRSIISPSILMGILTFIVIAAFAAIIYWILTPEASNEAPINDQLKSNVPLADSKDSLYAADDTVSMAEKAIIMSQQGAGSQELDDSTRLRTSMILSQAAKNKQAAIKKQAGKHQNIETINDSKSAVKSQKSSPKQSMQTSGKVTITGLKSIHVMEKGENLYTIAKKYLGSKDKVKYLIQYNKFKNPDLVTIGTKIRIPALSE
jgi:nucleoid DNA-binding protein